MSKHRRNDALKSSGFEAPPSRHLSTSTDIEWAHTLTAPRLIEHMQENTDAIILRTGRREAGVSIPYPTVVSTQSKEHPVTNKHVPTSSLPEGENNA